MRMLTFSEVDLVSGAWDWSDFFGATIVGGIAGAAGGACAGAAVGGVGALPGAGIGAVSGAIAGAVGYAGMEAWNAVFG